MFKSLLTVCAFACASLFAHGESHHPKPIKFTIHEKAYRFSNNFEFTQEEVPMGLVSKKRFAYGHLVNHYEVYDSEGKWEATGKSRILTLGALFSWATEIDVYNGKGKRVGMIDGQVFTMASARFSIYNYDETGKWTLAGIAFMDNEKKSFSIIDPLNDKRILCVLRRVFVPNVQDHWECNVFHREAIDERTIKVFAAFAVDHQEFFRADT